MSHTPVTRQAQKQRTREALLAAALGLLEEQSLSGLGLREVTRAAGVAPTAFYRHFASTADLGVALVEEALGGLGPLIRSTLSPAADGEERITRAVALVAGHVAAHPAHVRFVARERHGGVRPVREAIRERLARFAGEVAAELARDAESAGWSGEDLAMLAGLYVDQMLAIASLFLEAREAEDGAEDGAEAPATSNAPDAPERYRRAAETAARRMRLIGIGRRHWLD
ncbi:TetR family transcriptional regulator [Streptomyces sp. SCSIO 75703]|uniref:TetR family transcriptional regulator n=1 Tax=unclassified Streptomyces TaxID=2593676 RepID=UPI0004BE4606|nr:TetR family transcriptional regulator [Streptomyces sp. NRRL F-5065]